MEEENSLQITVRAKSKLQDALSDPDFIYADQDIIYETLISQMHIISFGSYLRRYICQKADITGDIQTEELVQIISDEFASRHVPPSFSETTARIKNLARNWLKQKTVDRKVVLILGFGLGMNVDDVNDFLTRALKEQGLIAKDPMEAICWYCYKNKKGYATYTMLWEKYKNAITTGLKPTENLEKTMYFKRQLSAVQTDDELIQYLMSVPRAENSIIQSVSARESFDRLYQHARELIAQNRTEMNQEEALMRADRLHEKLSHNDQYYDYQKEQMIEKQKQSYVKVKPEQIGPSDIEQTIYASVPLDDHGNLSPMKSSALNELFYGKRLSRKHINEILTGKGQIARTDLITLCFYIQADTDKSENGKDRYQHFEEIINEQLKQCDMMELYYANPYESFIAMCMYSESPLGTFADVWELSYSDSN